MTVEQQAAEYWDRVYSIQGPAADWRIEHLRDAQPAQIIREDMTTILSIVDGIELPSGPVRLVDLGCGTGRLFRALRECFDYVTGLEVSFSGRRYARANLLPGVELYDWTDAVEPGQIVLLSNVLGTDCATPAPILSRARELLREGGLLVLSHRDDWRGCASLCEQIQQAGFVTAPRAVLRHSMTWRMARAA